MSKQEDKTKDKDETTAPGADSSSEKTEGTSSVETVETTDASDVPAWVEEIKASNQAVLNSNQEIKDSNKAVLDSNQEVLEGIANFEKNASTVVGEIIEEAKKAGSSAPNEAEKNAPEVKVNKKARYVVAKGKRFQNIATGKIINEGADVSELSPDRLQRLLSQGIVEEAK